VAEDKGSLPMNLYVVIRWGNEASPDGPNGTDTTYLVRAPDRESAISLVEQLLREEAATKVVPYANVCIQLGTDSSLIDEATVLLGPIIQNFHNNGYPILWVRHYDDEAWISAIELDRE
jgi:hypothetical protein